MKLLSINWAGQRTIAGWKQTVSKLNTQVGLMYCNYFVRNSCSTFKFNGPRDCFLLTVSGWMSAAVFLVSGHIQDSLPGLLLAVVCRFSRVWQTLALPTPVVQT